MKTLLPRDAAVFLVGDCEFGSVKALKQLDQWHWFYVLRQKSDTCLWLDALKAWQPFRSFIKRAGQSIWLGRGYLTAQEIYPTNLLIHWAAGEKEPWCLATHLPDRALAWIYYWRRMWCEELHGDLKDHGFDLESTLLRNFEKLSRLTLAVAFLYVWLMSVGGRTIHDGSRRLVDPRDHRDLSIYQIGLRRTERNLPMTSLSLFRFSTTSNTKLSGG